MVLINMAKVTLLEKNCDHFGEVMIPLEVFNETVVAGKEKGKQDALLVEKMINNKKILVKEVKNKGLIAIANGFNVFDGEAEAFALYRESNADFLVSDDLNLRKKRDLLDAKIIGSLAVVLKLKKIGSIGDDKFESVIEGFREIGWFSNAILDKVLEEGGNYG